MTRWLVRFKRIFLVIILLAFTSRSICHGAVKLDALGVYLTSQGYGGAQLVHSGNYYHLPILSNNKPANLVVDTGAPTTLIYRSSANKLGLTESKTEMFESGLFGSSRRTFGKASMGVLTTGNCTLMNVPVAIASDVGYNRGYGDPNGLLGLREMVKFGAILDLNSRLIYLRPTRPGETVAAGVKAILTRQGWSPVDLSVAHLHLRVPAKINDVPCHLLVDTGSYLTTLDRNFAARAKIGGTPTEWTAYGIGKSGGEIRVASFASMWVSNYQIKHASASVVGMDAEMLSRGTDSEIEGLLGAEYLSLNSAVFDFVSGTLYMRPRSH